jgi:hypothetical protein
VVKETPSSHKALLALAAFTLPSGSLPQTCAPIGSQQQSSKLGF